MSEIIKSIEWARNTIQDRLMFGMEDAPLQAAYAREKRASGVLLDCKNEILFLKKEYQKLKTALEVAINEFSTIMDTEDFLDEDCSSRISRDKKALVKYNTIYLRSVAREAKKKIDEILNEQSKNTNEFED
jgi:hypothetical protein